MQFVFEMRYSYFGRSGWRSQASRDPERLFNQDRLKQRAYFFEKIALASLEAQTDKDFKVIILSSEDLPADHKRYLSEVGKDILGDRAHVIFREPDMAGNCFRRYLRDELSDFRYTAQVVLDDDDAVSVDFIEEMQREASAMRKLFRTKEEYAFLSQTQGISAVFRDDSCSLLHRCVPFNTQGLMLVARTKTRRNAFFTAHKKLHRNHPCRAIYGSKPFFIRAVHDFNDSRALIGEHYVTDEEMPSMIERFPLLKALLEDFRVRPH